MSIDGAQINIGIEVKGRKMFLAALVVVKENLQLFERPWHDLISDRPNSKYAHYQSSIYLHWSPPHYQ